MSVDDSLGNSYKFQKIFALDVLGKLDISGNLKAVKLNLFLHRIKLHPYVFKTNEIGSFSRKTSVSGLAYNPINPHPYKTIGFYVFLYLV